MRSGEESSPFFLRRLWFLRTNFWGPHKLGVHVSSLSVSPQIISHHLLLLHIRISSQVAVQQPRISNWALSSHLLFSKQNPRVADTTLRQGTEKCLSTSSVEGMENSCKPAGAVGVREGIDWLSEDSGKAPKRASEKAISPSHWP